MATQKPISTISYNTPAFLKEKLDAWMNAHIIQAYQFIQHKGEDGDKDHIHVRIEPNRRIDPMDLQVELREFVMGKDKPLGCRPFRPSKEEDWFLYAVHDAEYLKLKYGGGEKGEKLPYEWQSIVVPEYYDLETAFVRAKASLQHSTVSIATRIYHGENPFDLVMQGENVYSLNAVLHSLTSTDYTRAVSELATLSAKYESLCSAITDFGLQICYDNDGEVYLSRKEECKDDKMDARRTEGHGRVG